MNKRIYNIFLTLNSMTEKSKHNFAQGDSKTNYLKINFNKEIDLSYNMGINYILPSDQVITEKYSELKEEMELLVPDAAVKIIGEVEIEIYFYKGEETITVLKRGHFNVIDTVNGENIDTISGETIKNELHQVLSSVDDLSKECKKKS